MNKAWLHPKKTLKILFYLFLLIIFISIITFYWLFYSRVPEVSGKLPLKGLTAEVKVVRDSFGIPHIEAQTSTDAFRTLGFIMASERLFQMEMQKRMAYGELSELFGEKTLKMDKVFRNLQMRKQAESIFNQKIAEGKFDPQMLKEAEAFYDGVNQFQKRGPLPVEFLLLGIRPRPFTLLDAHAFIGVMSYSFGMATMQDPLFSALEARVGRKKVEELRFGFEEHHRRGQKQQLYVTNEASVPVEVTDLLSAVREGFPLFEGSNAWLLSGKRSSSGFPILASDPHITYSHPGLWFEAHIKTPDYESYGHHLAIIPFPVHAHNRNRGWGFTMSLTDDMDLYREKINWKNKTYEFKKKNYPLTENTEVIKIRGKAPLVLNVYSTRHGPVMDHALEEKNLALSWSFLGDFHSSTDLIDTLYRIGRANSMTEFKAAVKEGKAPGLNILYADKQNIAWWMFGEILLRKKSTRSDFILDGASGEDEPIRALRFDEKPFAENPPEGIIISTNNRPKAFPADQRGDFQPNDRYDTISQILAQKEKWDLEELKTIQTLSINFENKLILQKLLEITDRHPFWKDKGYEHFLETLKKWDFQSKKEKLAPLIYYSWLGFLNRLVLQGFNREDFIIFSRLSSGSAFSKYILNNDDSLWWDGRSQEKVLLKAFDETISFLSAELGSDYRQWNWGKMHTLELSHPLGMIKPLGKIFNLGPYAMDGAVQEINNQRYAGINFKIGAGPSTRRLIDFASPERAWGVLPAGNSGHILSPYYKDQVGLFSEGNYRGEFMNDADYKNADARTLIFYSEKI